MKITKAYDEKRGQWFVRYYKNRKRRWRFFDSEADALLVEKQWKNNLRLHGDPEPNPKRNIGVLPHEAIGEFIEEKKNLGQRPYTLRAYKSHFRAFETKFGGRDLANIGEAEMLRWEQQLEKNGLRRRTIKDYIAIVGQVYRFYDLPSPASKCISTRIKEDSSDVEYYSVKQVNQILLKAPDNIKPHVAMGLFAGLRPHEMMHNTSKTGVLRVHPGEGIRIPASMAKVRRPRLVDDVFPCLWTWLDTYPYSPIHYESFNRARKKLIEGLDFALINDGFRKTFATYFVAYADIARTAKTLGHKDLNMIYEHYMGLETKKTAKEYAKLTFDKVHKTGVEHQA